MKTRRLDRRPAKASSSLLELDSAPDAGFMTEDSSFIPTLTFLSGEALGKELPLVHSQITFGRAEDADVILMDPSISRRHARITCRKLLHSAGDSSLKVVLEDLGSKNGTFVNYRPVSKVVLKPGDKVCLGRVIFRFEHRDLADQNFYNEIYRMATTDNLTSLLNRAAITRFLLGETGKLRRYRGRLSVLLLQVDDFKELNDTAGTLRADQVLRATAEVLRRNTRQQDQAGRLGGDTFLLVLPQTGLAGALALAERIREEIDANVSKMAGLKRRVTASGGVATYHAPDETSEELLERATAALDRARSDGKNRIESGEEEDPSQRA